MKNNKKVWVRQMTSSKMVHEEPVINTNISDTESKESSEEQVKEDIQENINIPIMKASVEEKKTNNYNLFLTYRLQELKKGKKGSNKELFTTVVAEWKELKKKPDELNKILLLAQEFQAKRAA
jgi:hypothetical protein